MEQPIETQESAASAFLILLASGLILIAVMLLACGVCFAQQGTPATPFGLPQQLTPVREGISLSDLTALHTALNADAEIQNGDEGPPDYSPDQFGESDVTPVDLGALGHGMIVYFNKSGACGATGNCPMALYIRRNGTFVPALHFGGWGSWTMPSAGGPPYIVSAWNMSCCDEIYTRYVYRKEQYFGDACAEGQTDPDATDSGKMSWKPCKPGTPTFTPPDNMQSSGAANPTFVDLEELQAVARADLKQISAPAFASLPVIKLSHWFVVGVSAATGMRLFVYPRLRSGIGQAVLRDIDAGFAAEIETGQGANSSGPPSIVPVPALVLAKRRGDIMELKLYTQQGSDQPELPANAHMELEACEQAIPKSGGWPAAWDPDALRVHTVACAQK